MVKRKEQQEPVVPPQDKRICGGICLCQFTIVISCVSLVYLAVAVYMPSYRAFTFGMEPRPVMCQTVNTTMVNSCDWASCGEWCLTKTSGFCPQIHVTTRRNGTKMVLEECTRLMNFSCPKAKPEELKPYNCNNDTMCTDLTGVYYCRLGHCANWSMLFLCHNRFDGILVDSTKDNLKLNGMFKCHHSKCQKISEELDCDRYCTNITTAGKNVFVQYYEYTDSKIYGDNLFVGDCKRAVAYTSANGNEEGTEIDRTVIWNEDIHGKLIVSCHTVTKNGSSLIGTDCINGTVIKDKEIPLPATNFTTFWKIVERSETVLDPTFRFLPPQSSLTIYNYSRVYINLEGCVNTLRGECEEFARTHGNDGDNKTTQSRFTCFYRKNDTASPRFVVTRFDLGKTWFELMIAIFVPSTLFVLSFITLMVIGYSVQVGDDTRMRCVLFSKLKNKQTREEMNAEMDLVMDGIIERTNAMADDQPTTANTCT